MPDVDFPFPFGPTDHRMVTGFVRKAAASKGIGRMYQLCTHVPGRNVVLVATADGATADDGGGGDGVVVIVGWFI